MQLMSIKVGLLSVPLLKASVREKGGLGGFAPQTLTRSYYFEPPLSKKRSRATGVNNVGNIQNFQCPLGVSGPSLPGNMFDFLKALDFSDEALLI